MGGLAFFLLEDFWPAVAFTDAVFGVTAFLGAAFLTAGFFPGLAFETAFFAAVFFGAAFFAAAFFATAFFFGADFFKLAALREPAAGVLVFVVKVQSREIKAEN